MAEAKSLICCLLLVGGADEAEPAKEHPLIPVIRAASEHYQRMEQEIRDYSCTLVKRERIDGILLDPEYINVLLRHQQVRQGRVETPFSVHLRFLAPEELKGREVVYVHGRNGGKLIARKGGPRFAFMTRAVAPDSELAMQRNRYPITDIGIKNLIRKLLEVAYEDLQYDECEVRYYAGAKVNGRTCTAIQVTHPVRRKHFRYHIARIFIDDELQVPVRYASYDWPKQEGGRPILLEEYTYLNLKLDVGLTDWDFDPDNGKYGFSKVSGR
jgi:hypothetical protein